MNFDYLASGFRCLPPALTHWRARPVFRFRVEALVKSEMAGSFQNVNVDCPDVRLTGVLPRGCEDRDAHGDRFDYKAGL